MTDLNDYDILEPEIETPTKMDQEQTFPSNNDNWWDDKFETTIPDFSLGLSTKEDSSENSNENATISINVSEEPECNYKQVERNDEENDTDNKIKNDEESQDEKSEDEEEHTQLNSQSISVDSNYVDSGRRFHRDSLLKKFKTHLMMFIIKLINKQSGLKRLKLKLKRLPNILFNSNVKINFNQSLLPKTINEIFTTFWGKTNCEREIQHFNNNRIVMEHIVLSDDGNLRNFVDMTFEELIDLYLKSKEFKKDMEKIEWKECKYRCPDGMTCFKKCTQYINEFEKIAEGSISYFKESKGNTTTKVKKAKAKRFFKITKLI